MKIKAAVLNTMGVEAPYAKSKPLAIEEVELDDPSHGEVLVKIGAAGLCHSDLSVIDGNRPRPTPMVLGHEAAGIVEKLGSGVDDLKVGDHVVMVFVPSCGHCIPCAEGRPALCEPGAAANGAGTLLSGERRLHRNGSDVHHHLGVSAFADHATVSRRSLVKIDRELPLDEAALFGCAVLTGVGAVINTAKVPAGSSVAVIGLGGVGLSSLLGAVAVGARRVVAIDLSDDKLGLARQLGATGLGQVNAAGRPFGSVHLRLTKTPDRISGRPPRGGLSDSTRLMRRRLGRHCLAIRNDSLKGVVASVALPTVPHAPLIEVLRPFRHE